MPKKNFSWSLSSLGTYEKCGAKYDYKYNQRLEERRSNAAGRGIGKHSVIESYLKGDITTVTDDLSFYQNFLQGLKQYENYPEHKVALDRNWRWTLWGADDVWYKGVLDLKVIKRAHLGPGGEATEAVVFDWKSGKIYPDHDDQKSLYSLATFSEHPTLYSVRAVHVYLDLGENREKTYHRDEVHQLREHWERRVHKLEDNPQLIPNPGYHCRWCSFSRGNGGPCRF